ncbi:unnamed protein product, partial [Mesorhabditis belari]|uniref:Uncharacterized protein n=1 Tax=Mesorhabditis belari TaxID=2138241 RepID=A0AAF3FAS3_9BILA
MTFAQNAHYDGCKKKNGHGSTARSAAYHYINGKRNRAGRKFGRSMYYDEQSPMVMPFDSPDTTDTVHIPPPRRYQTPHEKIQSLFRYAPQPNNIEEVHTGRIDVSVLFKPKSPPTVSPPTPIGSERAAAMEAKRRVSLEMRQAVMQKLGQESPNMSLTPSTPNSGTTWSFELPEINPEYDYGMHNDLTGWACGSVTSYADLISSMKKLNM